MPDDLVEEELRKNRLLHEKANRVADSMFSRDCDAWGNLKNLVLGVLVEYELDILQGLKRTLAIEVKDALAQKG